jgi:hypothetical protein
MHKLSVLCALLLVLQVLGNVKLFLAAGEGCVLTVCTAHATPAS